MTRWEDRSLNKEAGSEAQFSMVRTSRFSSGKVASSSLVVPASNIKDLGSTAKSFFFSQELFSTAFPTQQTVFLLSLAIHQHKNALISPWGRIRPFGIDPDFLAAGEFGLKLKSTLKVLESGDHRDSDGWPGYFINRALACLRRRIPASFLAS